MDHRASYYTRVVKEHDRELLVKRDPFGVLKVYRKGLRYDRYKIGENTLVCSIPVNLFILPLTNNWSVTGEPVEWGAEPLIQKIKESDFHRDGILASDKLRAQREKAEEAQQRAARSDFQAIAGELRSEFAKATNDINTSTLEKVDNRRKKDGYFKS